LDEAVLRQEKRDIDLVALDGALTELGTYDERKHKAVELRCLWVSQLPTRPALAALGAPRFGADSFHRLPRWGRNCAKSLLTQEIPWVSS
jgi:hypothetical protein